MSGILCHLQYILIEPLGNLLGDSLSDKGRNKEGKLIIYLSLQSLSMAIKIDSHLLKPLGEHPLMLMFLKKLLQEGTYFGMQGITFEKSC